MTDQRIAEITARCEAATPEMLRIHREMLDICNMDFSDRDAAWFYTWIAEWFNTIKQHWPFDDIPYLLGRLAEYDKELKRLQKEVASLAIESIEREKTLAKLEAEVTTAMIRITG